MAAASLPAEAACCTTLDLWGLATDDLATVGRVLDLCHLGTFVASVRRLQPELCWKLGDAVIRRRFVLACR